MAKAKTQDKLDKRAAALRDNLKRRKQKAKAEKTSKESKDGTAKSDQ